MGDAGPGLMIRTEAEAAALARRVAAGGTRIYHAQGPLNLLKEFDQTPGYAPKPLPEVSQLDVSMTKTPDVQKVVGDLDLVVISPELKAIGKKGRWYELPTGERLHFEVGENGAVPRALEGLANPAKDRRFFAPGEDPMRIRLGVEVLEGVDGTRLTVSPRGKADDVAAGLADEVLQLRDDAGTLIAEAQPDDLARLVERGVLKVWEPPAQFKDMDAAALRAFIEKRAVSIGGRKTKASAEMLDAWRQYQRIKNETPSLDRLQIEAAQVGGAVVKDAKPGTIKFSDKVTLETSPKAIAAAAAAQGRIDAVLLQLEQAKLFEASSFMSDVMALAPDEDLLQGIQAQPQATGGDSVFSGLIEQVREIEGSGPQGRRVAGRILNTAQERDILRSRYTLELERLGNQPWTSEAEILSVAKFIEKGTPTTPLAEATARRIMALDREMFDTAQRLGIPTASDLGPTHFPRIYEQLDRFEVGGDLHAAGKKALGEKGLMDWIRQQKAQPTSRLAGGLERERLTNMPGYTQDFRRAYAVHFAKGSRRLAEARHYGVKGKAIEADIDLLPPKLAEKARLLIKQDLGNDPIEIPQLLAMAGDAANFRLLFTPIMAMTEAGKVWQRGGTKAFLGALGDFVRNPRLAQQRAKWIGATMDDVTYAMGADSMALEREVINDFRRPEPVTALGKALKRGGGAIAGMSGIIDNNTRTLSTLAQQRSWDDLVARLFVSSGADDFARGELRSAGLDPDKLWDALRAGNGEKVSGFNAFYRKRVADETVFTMRPGDRPRVLQSAMGRVVGKFKLFSIASARFSWRELNAWRTIGGPAGRARTMRMLALMTVVNPAAAMAVMPLRDWVTQRREPSLPELNQLWRDKGFMGWAQWAVATNASIGTAGLFSDLAGAVATGNINTISNLGRPAAANILADAYLVGRYSIQAIHEEDSERWVQAGERAAGLAGGSVGTGLFRRAVGAR